MHVRELSVSKNTPYNDLNLIIHFHHVFFVRGETFVRRQITFHRNFRPVGVCFKAINPELRPPDTPIIVLPRSPIDMTRSFVPMYFPIYSLFSSTIPSLFEHFAHELLQKSLRKNQGLILTHFGHHVPYAVRLAKVLKTPLLIYFYGYDATVILTKSPNYYKPFASRVDAAFALSEYLRRRLEGKFEVPVYVNGLGIDPQQYIYRDPKIIDSLDDKKPIKLITVGRLIEFKGHEYLIYAHKILKQKKYNIETIIIGMGPRYKLLSALVRRLNLDSVVKFQGELPHEKVISHLNSADIFVFPSVLARDGSTETLGYACVEAMASGLPVVASNVGGLPEYVKNNETGLLVDQRSPKQIAEAVEELISNPKKAARLARNARKLVEEQFNIHKNMIKMESILAKYLPKH